MYRKKKKYHPEETAIIVVGCVAQNDWSDCEKSEPGSPVLRVKHACEGAETYYFRFSESIFDKSWPCRLDFLFEKGCVLH